MKMKDYMEEAIKLSRDNFEKRYGGPFGAVVVKDGKIIFFSTHILDVAEKLCSKVAIIKQGKLIKVGSMKEIKGDKSLEKVFLELEEK